LPRSSFTFSHIKMADEQKWYCVRLVEGLVVEAVTMYSFQLIGMQVRFPPVVPSYKQFPLSFNQPSIKEPQIIV
jgi:hypothetical protein